ncbi:MAG: D-alanyl-D-alanine carboxypeptidase family protein [Lachnospirales bacterium]
MKKIIEIGAVFIMCVFMITTAFAEDLPSVISKSAILLDSKTGRVLWGKEHLAQMPMASTTKIMTLLVALENSTGDEEVIVTKRASKAPDVQLDIVEGEKFRLGDLFYPLMLESSNDVAIAIAEAVGGTVEDFAIMMTEKAKEIGAKNTSFKNPNGLDEEGHYTTAYDLALITKYALENDRFREIIGTKSYNFKSDKRSYAVNNKNRLLSSYSGGTGVKTGYTNQAANCFVGSANRDDMELISVVLQAGWGSVGREGKWDDTYKILNYGFENYKYYTLVEKNTFEVGMAKVNTSKTEEVPIVYTVDEDINMPLTAKEYETLEIVTEYKDKLDAPVEKGEVVGETKVYLNDEVIAVYDVITTMGAEIHDFIAMFEKTMKTYIKLGFDDDINIDLRKYLENF